MRLHNNRAEFQELITLTAREKHIPEDAVKAFEQINSLLTEIGE